MSKEMVEGGGCRRVRKFEGSRGVEVGAPTEGEVVTLGPGSPRGPKEPVLGGETCVGRRPLEWGGAGRDTSSELSTRTGQVQVLHSL